MPVNFRFHKKPEHRRRGFEHVSGLLQREFRTVGEQSGFAVARLLTHWTEVVDADIARIARPVKVVYSKGKLGATLTLLTSGPQAPILAMKLDSVRERVNACYGYSAISDVVITQTTPADFERGAPADKQYSEPGQEPDAYTRNLVRTAVADVSDDGLRRALEFFGEGVLTKRSRK